MWTHWNIQRHMLNEAPFGPTFKRTNSKNPSKEIKPTPTRVSPSPPEVSTVWQNPFAKNTAESRNLHISVIIIKPVQTVLVCLCSFCELQCLFVFSIFMDPFYIIFWVLYIKCNSNYRASEHLFQQLFVRSNLLWEVWTAQTDSHAEILPWTKLCSLLFHFKSCSDIMYLF